MSLTTRERVTLGIHRGLDRWLSPLGVAVFRRTKGGIAKPFKVDALLLTTRGRKSGKARTVVLQYFPDGPAMVVVAANDGGERYPGWYHNLRTDPMATAEVMGRAIRVTVEELGADDAAAWWGRIVARSPDYERYRRATGRPFPILRLVPVGAVAPPGP